MGEDSSSIIDTLLAESIMVSSPAEDVASETNFFTGEEAPLQGSSHEIFEYREMASSRLEL